MLGKLVDSFIKERKVYLVLFTSIWAALLLDKPIWQFFILAGSTLFAILKIVINEAWSRKTTGIVLAIGWSLLLAFMSARTSILLIPNEPLVSYIRVFVVGLLVQWLMQSIVIHATQRKAS